MRKNKYNKGSLIIFIELHYLFENDIAKNEQ